MKTRNLILRIVVSPFVLGLILVSYLIYSLKRWIDFIKYGGEWINYDKQDKVTIQMIYEELRHERLKRDGMICKSCNKEFNELDKKLHHSRPDDICVACFTSNA